MKEAKMQYEKRERRYSRLHEKQKKTEMLLSNLRLVVFVIGAAAAVWMFLRRDFAMMAAALIFFSVAFLYLVIRHSKLINRIKYTKVLRDINRDSLKRLSGDWHTFADNGADFADENHRYAGDLDVFGKGSVFQWINTANTYIGRIKLSELLSGVVGGWQDILERQEAVDELVKMLAWRQRLMAEGLIKSERMHNPEEFMSWAKESNEIFRKPWAKVILRICPAITVLLVLAGLIMNIISWHWPVAALVIQYGLLSYKAKERKVLFSINERYNSDLRVYYNMLKHVETYPFKSLHILSILNEIKHNGESQAYRQLDKLSGIIDSVSDRSNAFYFFFNILTLWDFQNLIALEAWKQKSGAFIKSWLEGLGRIEALASLAVIGFENPNWAKPVISDGGEAVLEAKEMGHPLLSGKRVHNSMAITDQTKVMLITGSNMSGKSTLLRTAGINLVLAYAGAPVCADAMRASIMEIYSCMRVRDNLEESISSFYAELLRIKEIVSEAKSGKQMFYLLDEIFKGTNSLDRHKGASVLIQSLSLTNSIGMVSTHDLELCDLAEKNERVVNYHFREYYRAGKIHFDYELRPGPSTTRNALYLMRLAGIEVEEDSLS